MDRCQTNTYQYGNVEILVHRPILDDQERQKREATLKRAVASYGKSMLQRRQKG